MNDKQKNSSKPADPSLVDTLTSQDDILDQTEKYVRDVASKLQQALHFDRDNLNVTAELPGLGWLGHETLTLAVSLVLSEKFGIELPQKTLTDINAGIAVQHAIASKDPNLPPRTVAVTLAPKMLSFAIHGKPCENGRDGYSTLAFEWQRRPGRFDQTGIVDLKKLNTYPSIKKDALLATIFHPTPGRPGVTCQGKKISQKTGKALRVQFDAKNIQKIDKAKSYQLVASTSGIVNFSLLAKDNPQTLTRLEIADQITISGDVNYGVGDLGKISESDIECPSSLVIHGRVRGAFSLQSNGFIHVSDSIEGKSVSAREVKAAMITNNCHVRAEEQIQAGTIAHAQVEADSIVVTSTANNSVLNARGTIRFENNATCLSLKMSMKNAMFTRVTFSGRNEVELGTDQFVRMQQFLDELRGVEKKESELLQPLKDLAAPIITNLTRVNEVLVKTVQPLPVEIKEEALVMKKMVLSLLTLSPEINHQAIIDTCYHFQALLGEHRIHDSILQIVETLVHKIQNYTQEQQTFLELLQKKAFLLESCARVHSEITNDLTLEFKHCTLRGANAELHIRCGKTKRILTAENFPGKPFRMHYKSLAAEGEYEDIDMGQLITVEIES